MEKEQEQRDRLEEEQAAVLPAREAMSIITATDAQGSPSGEETVGADTRSGQSTNQDSATSET